MAVARAFEDSRWGRIAPSALQADCVDDGSIEHVSSARLGAG